MWELLGCLVEMADNMEGSSADKALAQRWAEEVWWEGARLCAGQRQANSVCSAPSRGRPFSSS